MARILRDTNKKGVGAPRGRSTGISPGISTAGGGRVSPDVSKKSGIRRLIARNPAKGTSANIGTKRDVGAFTNTRPVNVTGQPRPRILRNLTQKSREASGTKHVVTKLNRAVRRLK